jgi:tartronate-semialdehyde synthase
MPKMTVADAAVAILRREGITNVFGLPGAAINPFYAAMRRDGRITRAFGVPGAARTPRSPSRGSTRLSPGPGGYRSASRRGPRQV